MCNFNLKTYITENKINTFIDENKSIAKHGEKNFKGKFLPKFSDEKDIFHLADLPNNFDNYADSNFKEEDSEILFKYGTEIARGISNMIPHKDFDKLTMDSGDIFSQPVRNKIAINALKSKIHKATIEYVETNDDLFDVYEKYKNNDVTAISFLVDLILEKFIYTTIGPPNDKFFYKTLDFDRDIADKSNFSLASKGNSQTDLVKSYENYLKVLKVFKKDAIERKANKEYKPVYQSYKKFIKPLSGSGYLEGAAILKWGDPIKQIKQIEDFANQTLDWVTINVPPEDWYEDKILKKIITDYVSKNKGERTKPETWIVAGYPVYPNAVDEIKKHYPAFGRNIETFQGKYSGEPEEWFQIVRSPFEPFILERKSKVFEDLINLKIEEGLDNLAPLYSLPPQKNSDFN
jgi:hypothetical protein